MFSFFLSYKVHHYEYWDRLWAAMIGLSSQILGHICPVNVNDIFVVLKLLTFFRLHIAFIRYFQSWDTRLCYLTIVLQNQFEIFLYFSMQIVSAITAKLRFFSHDLDRFTLIRTHWYWQTPTVKPKSELSAQQWTLCFRPDTDILTYKLTSDIFQSFWSICGTQTLLYGPANPVTCPCHIPRFYSKMALKFICS